VFPEPAKATTTRDRFWSRATKPLMSAPVVSFLFKIRKIRSVIRVRTYKPPNSTREVTLSASTSGQTPNGQVISASEVEFSFLGQYEAAVKFANSLKLPRRDSDIPIVVKSLSVQAYRCMLSMGWAEVSDPTCLLQLISSIEKRDCSYVG
jgi:hypothetical protein